MLRAEKTYQSGAASRFLDQKLERGIVSFSLGDMLEQTGLSEVAARNQLLRLEGRVARVSPRQQYFLIVTPDHRGFGAPPVESWLGDYFGWLGRPYYLALQSAAAVYGSSPQAIQETQVVTDMARRDITVGRIRVRFFMKSGVERSITQQLPKAPAPLSVSTPETTVYDLVRYAQNIGGIERVAETIAPMLTTVRAGMLVRVLDAEGEIATAQRLGFVLEELGAHKLAGAVRRWLPAKIHLITITSKGVQDSQAAVDRSWGIINNSKVFHD